MKLWCFFSCSTTQTSVYDRDSLSCCGDSLWPNTTLPRHLSICYKAFKKIIESDLFYCRGKTVGKVEASLEPPPLLCKRSSGWIDQSKSSLNKGCNYLGASRLFSAPQKNNGLSLLRTLFLSPVTSVAGGSRGLIYWVQ